MNISILMKPVAVVLVIVTIIAGLNSFHVAALSPLQSKQGSAAWVASFWFARVGTASSRNYLYFIASNLGSQSVNICAIIYYGGNGTAAANACSPNAVAPHADWGSFAWEGRIGAYGTVILYSKDSATPIQPGGALMIDQQDQQGTGVINAAVTLQWNPTAPPSS